MTAYKIDVQCNNCEEKISFTLYGDKTKLICPNCEYEEGKAKAYEGFIYVMWNPRLKDYIKVGRAIDPENRARQHSTGGVPGKYEIMALFPSNNQTADEKKALKKLKSYKDKNSKEVFKICPALATRKIQLALSRRETAFMSKKIQEEYEKIIAENKLRMLGRLKPTKKKRKSKQGDLF
jgi:hypothetical protein